MTNPPSRLVPRFALAAVATAQVSPPNQRPTKSEASAIVERQRKALAKGFTAKSLKNVRANTQAPRDLVAQNADQAPGRQDVDAALQPLVPAETPTVPAEQDPVLSLMSDAHVRFKQYTANSNQFVGGHTDHYRNYVHLIDAGGLEANCAARGMFALATPLSPAPVASHPPKSKSASATPGDSLQRQLCAVQEDMIDQHFKLLLWFATPDNKEGMKVRGQLEASLKTQIAKRFNFTDVNTFCTLFSVQLFNRIELMCKAMVEAPPSQTKARAQELLGKVRDFKTDLIWAHMLIKDAARTVKDVEIRSTLEAYADSFARMEALLSNGDGIEKGEFERLTEGATQAIQRADERTAAEARRAAEAAATTMASTPQGPKVRKAKRSLNLVAAQNALKRLDPTGQALRPLQPAARQRANGLSRPARSA
jgi:hypothetical protein